MNCPVCHGPSHILETRRFKEQESWTKRQRECLSAECKHRWFTLEIPAEELDLVKELFD